MPTPPPSTSTLTVCYPKGTPGYDEGTTPCDVLTGDTATHAMEFFKRKIKKAETSFDSALYSGNKDELHFCHDVDDCPGSHKGSTIGATKNVTITCAPMDEDFGVCVQDQGITNPGKVWHPWQLTDRDERQLRNFQ